MIPSVSRRRSRSLHDLISSVRRHSAAVSPDLDRQRQCIVSNLVGLHVKRTLSA